MGFHVKKRLIMEFEKFLWGVSIHLIKKGQKFKAVSKNITILLSESKALIKSIATIKPFGEFQDVIIGSNRVKGSLSLHKSTLIMMFHIR